MRGLCNICRCLCCMLLLCRRERMPAVVLWRYRVFQRCLCPGRIRNTWQGMNAGIPVRVPFPGVFCPRTGLFRIRIFFCHPIRECRARRKGCRFSLRRSSGIRLPNSFRFLFPEGCNVPRPQTSADCLCHGLQICRFCICLPVRTYPRIVLRRGIVSA